MKARETQKINKNHNNQQEERYVSPKERNTQVWELDPSSANKKLSHVGRDTK